MSQEERRSGSVLQQFKTLCNHRPGSPVIKEDKVLIFQAIFRAFSMAPKAVAIHSLLSLFVSPSYVREIYKYNALEVQNAEELFALIYLFPSIGISLFCFFGSCIPCNITVSFRQG